MNDTLRELDLSVRMYNFLRRNGITSREQLLAMSDDEILGIAKGGICMAEVISKIRPLRKDMSKINNDLIF